MRLLGGILVAFLVNFNHKGSGVHGTAEEPITCYVCLNVTDNKVCNDFAIDRPCQDGAEACHTLHEIDHTGASVLVNKKCAAKEDCIDLGCRRQGNYTSCSSCCFVPYCNEIIPAPTNLVLPPWPSRSNAHALHNGSNSLATAVNSQNSRFVLVLHLLLYGWSFITCHSPCIRFD